MQVHSARSSGDLSRLKTSDQDGRVADYLIGIVTLSSWSVQSRFVPSFLQENPRIHLSICVSVISGTYRRRIQTSTSSAKMPCLCCCLSKRCKFRATVAESTGISGTTEPFFPDQLLRLVLFFSSPLYQRATLLPFPPFSLFLSVPSPTVFSHKRFAVIFRPPLKLLFISVFRRHWNKSTAFLYHHLEHLLPL